MPKLCGLELLQKIRQADNERIRKLPVLVMTSIHDGQTLSVVQQLGGDGLLQKPLDKQATLAVILELVAGRHSLAPLTLADDDRRVHGRGVISPTLRRLLKTVARSRQASR